jgi:hypothetical protein
MEESANDKALEEFKIQGRSLRPGSTSLFYGQGRHLFNFKFSYIDGVQFMLNIIEGNSNF